MSCLKGDRFSSCGQNFSDFYFGTVAVHDLHAISGAAKVLADFLGDHHRAMLSTGAAESDRQIAFSLVNVVRQQIDEKIGDARDEFARLGKGPDVFGHARIAPRERAEFGNEMRVGQEANIENKIGIFGNALAKSEADARDQNAFFCRLFVKALVDVRAQLVHVELRSVDDEIGEAADGA